MTFFLENKSLLRKLNDIIQSTIEDEYDKYDYEYKSITDIFDINDFMNKLKMMHPNGTISITFRDNISQKARRTLNSYFLYELNSNSGFQETGFKLDAILKIRYEIKGIILQQNLNMINL